MLVKIRLQRGPTVRYRPGGRRRLALAFAAFLHPAALMAAALAGWRLTADIGWAGDFPFSSGMLSHWQVWIGAAAVLVFTARILNRYGQRADSIPPRSSGVVTGV